MSIETGRILVRTLHPLFVGEVSGVDLTRPLDDATFNEIRDTFFEHGVLVFHDQPLTDEQQIAFSERFGPLETSISTYRSDRARRLARPELSDISNLDEHGNVMSADDERRHNNRGNQLWHTDSSFKPVPAMASMLSAREVPPSGGETEYADLRAAWDALPPARQQELEGLIAEHSILYSRSLIGYQFTEEEQRKLHPVQQTVVRVHPTTRRKGLYLASHASHIVGRPVEEGRALLRELLEFATQPRFVYRHPWRVGDLVMWDNRSVLHRGRPWDEQHHRRVMHRTTVAGLGPTVVDGRVQVGV
jgi:alpha-ketoglutarate-dependent 2,4-dichlorophenoxyacetate dioxygenase